MDHTYSARAFALPELKGLSTKQLEVHLKLYQGYVTNTNTLRATLAELRNDSEKNAYAIAEVLRRLGFEFDGMRMHEYYFEQFDGGATTLAESSALAETLATKYGSFDDFLTHFTSVGMMRGIGWTILYYDPIGKTPHVAWVGDHEIGQLAGLPIILAMDMWEHAYMVDYVPGEKKQYISAFLDNVNWETVAKRFDTATSR